MRLVSDSVKKWIYVPLVLIIVFNLILFLVFQQAHPDESFAVQLWSYFESVIFQAITGSLLFPIFIFLLERRFRIIEKREEERKEKQLKSMEESTKKWNELYGIVNEVIYFEKENHRYKMNDILKRLDDSLSTSIDITYSWEVQFTYFESRHTELITFFEKIMYRAAKSVGNYIISTDNKQEISNLQGYLMMIQRAFGTHSHTIGIELLGMFVILEDSELSKEKRNRIQELVEDLNGKLEKIKKAFQEIEFEFYQVVFLSGYDVDKIETFLKHRKEEANLIQNDIFFGQCEDKDIMELIKQRNVVLNLMQSSRKSDPNELKEYEDLKELFRKIPSEKRLSLEKFAYPKEYIKFLADTLSIRDTSNYLKLNRT